MYIVDVNRNFLTFYSVIIFTCITSMFSILQRLDRKHDNVLNHKLLRILYCMFILGGLYSIRRCVSIYRYSAAITNYGPINETLKEFTKIFPTYIDHYILTPVSPLVEAIVIAIFCFIFLTLILNHARDALPHGSSIHSCQSIHHNTWTGGRLWQSTRFHILPVVARVIHRI